jgi:hypothetical protein
MIGLFASHAATYALAFAAFSTLAFAVPFIFAPAGWGRAMRWTVPAERDLMAYYARCLGLLALSVNALGVWGALVRPDVLLGYFVVSALFSGTMVPLHVYGWARGQQPWTETAEIPAWTLACLGALLFFPVRF